jgi:hypothetical protein
VAVSNVELRVNANNAVSQLQRTSKEAKKLDRAAVSATGNIQRMGVAFRATASSVVGLYAAFNVLNSTLKVAGSRQTQVATLANGIKKLGLQEASVQKLVEAADRLGKATLFDEEDFTQAFTLLTSFQRIGVNSYERVAKAAADVAQVTGQDVRSSMLQLAKALEDPAKQVTALARSGTVFTEQQKEQIKALQESGRILEAQNLVLKELEKQYGGAAIAAGEAGIAGAMDTLGEVTRDLQEEIGNFLLPTVIDLAKNATNLIRAISDLPDPVKRSIGVAATFATKLFLVQKAMQAIIALRAGITATLGATAAGMTTAGNAAGVANPKLLLAKNTLFALARIGLITIGIDIIVNGLGKLAEVEARMNRIAKSTTKGFAAEVGGSALSKAEIEKLMKENRAEFKRREDEFKSVKFPLLTAQDDIAKAAMLQLDTRLATLQSMYDRARFATPEDRAAADAKRKPQIPISTGNGKKESRGGRTGTGKTEAEKAAEKRLELERSLTFEAIQQADNVKAIIEDRRIENELLQLELDKGKEFADTTRSINELVRSGVPFSEAFKLVEANQLITEQIEKQKELQEAQKAAAAEMDQLYGAIGDSIQTGIVDSLTAAVDGTKSLAEVASDTLRSLANIMLKFGLQTFLGGLGGGDPNNIFTKLFGGGRASGGTVKGGTSYLVGERGPELFTPGRSGSIAPNNAMGGANVTVNVDASGSSVQGDGQNAAQLGKAIGLAVQTELRKQQRPGGILAR